MNNKAWAAEEREQQDISQTENMYSASPKERKKNSNSEHTPSFPNNRPHDRAHDNAFGGQPFTESPEEHQR